MRLEMIAEGQRLGIALLVGLSVLGCTRSVATFEPPASFAHPLPAPGCPYASMYVAVSTNGSSKDARIAKRVRLAYSEFLAEQGFSVVAAAEEAYWSAFSMVRLNHRIDSAFAWTVYVMATQDLQGRIQTPVNFSAEGEAADEFSGYMLLREVRIVELEDHALGAAAETAVALLPHTFRMCVAWSTQPDEQVARQAEEISDPEEGDEFHRLLEALQQEIARARRQRKRDTQRKQLEIELENGPGL